MAHQAHPIPRDVSAQSLCVTVDIAAPANRVWEVLTTKLQNWWNLNALDDGQMALELRAGGRLYEHATDGSEILWYTVNAIMIGKSMTLWGHVSPPWARPSNSMVQWQIETIDDGRSRFIHTEVLTGVQTPRLLQQLEAGWKGMFEGPFKAACEGKP